MGNETRKLFEINGTVEVPPELTEDEFWDTFIEFIELHGWSFGGGINMIVDDYYINDDGSQGKYVLDEE